MCEGFGVLDRVEVSNIHSCTILNRQQEGSKVFIPWSGGKLDSDWLQDVH